MSSTYKPTMKKMFFKKKTLAPKPDDTPTPSPQAPVATPAATVLNKEKEITVLSDDDEPRVTSKTSSAAKGKTKAKAVTPVPDSRSTPEAPPSTIAAAEKKPVNDLDFWGRSKDVHQGMLKRDEARRKEREAERKKRAEEKAKQEEEEARLREEEEFERLINPNKRSAERSSGGAKRSGRKRRKSDEDGNVAISDEEDEGADGNSRDDADFKPSRVSAEPRSPAKSKMQIEDFDKVMARIKRNQELRAAAVSVTTIDKPALPTKNDPNDIWNDTVVNILIVSTIEGTKSQIFKYKYGNTLGKVRECWAKIQQMSPQDIDRLVLVWRMETRVFDSTRVRTLGVRFDGDGRMYIDDAEKRRRSVGIRTQDEEAAVMRGIDPDEAKIMFTAMWVEDFEDIERQREEEQRKRLESDESEVEDIEDFVSQTLAAKPMFITLRGKDFQELKLKVKLDMKISDVIKQIREERKIDDDTEIELHFDGDELELHVTLEEAEIENDFQIDVVLS